MSVLSSSAWPGQGTAFSGYLSQAVQMSTRVMKSWSSGGRSLCWQITCQAQVRIIQGWALKDCAPLFTFYLRWRHSPDPLASFISDISTLIIATQEEEAAVKAVQDKFSELKVVQNWNKLWSEVICLILWFRNQRLHSEDNALRRVGCW